MGSTTLQAKWLEISKKKIERLILLRGFLRTIKQENKRINHLAALLLLTPQLTVVFCFPGAAGNIPMSRIFSQLHDLMYVYKSQVRCLSAGPLYEDLKPAPFQCIAIDDAEDYLPRVRR